nr:hypothetical protein [Tanacetum cinerariifolium]
KGGDEVRESKGESDDEETREEEDKNFDPIPKTPEEIQGSANEGGSPRGSSDTDRLAPRFTSTRE